MTSIAELSRDPDHPLRGAWLAERLRRRDENRLIRERRERIEAAAWDILAFGRTYLAHYFTDQSAAFHRELVGLLTDMDEFEWYKTEPDPDHDPEAPTERRELPEGIIDFVNHPLRKRRDPSTGNFSTKQGIAIAAPRGHSKSTLLTLLIPLYCACYRLRKFLVVVSDAQIQVRSFCSDIKREIEENELIRADFGILVGSHWGKKWTGEDFSICHGAVDEAGHRVVLHEMRIAGRSTGSSMRGLRNRESRPDLMIIDDMENDTHVETREQRDKLFAKVNGAMVPMLDPHDGLLLFCGTILHFDSVLSRLLAQDADTKDTYVQRRWAAADRDVLDDAAVPLWPERFPLEYLRTKRKQMPVRQFNQEYMNNPHDPETRDFRPEWVRWYHPRDLRRLQDGTILWRHPEARVSEYDPDRDGWQELRIYQAVDPAISRNDRADYFAMLAGGLAAESEDIILLWLSHDRFNFAGQVREIHSMGYTYPRTRLIGVEAIAYQEALREAADSKAARSLTKMKVPLTAIRQRSGPLNKEARLRRRGVEVERGYVWLRRLDPGDRGYHEAPWDETGTIKIHPNIYPLYLEMMQFPNAAHDDCLDALDMLVEIMQRKKMFAGFADEDRRATRAGKVPTSRTKGRRATVPGLNPDWQPTALPRAA